MRPLEYGKLKKLGPGHYRVIWPKKRKRKSKAERRRGGRPPAPEYPDTDQTPPVEESTTDGP